jgi:hypothetical protein
VQDKSYHFCWQSSGFSGKEKRDFSAYTVGRAKARPYICGGEARAPLQAGAVDLPFLFEIGAIAEGFLRAYFCCGEGGVEICAR